MRFNTTGKFLILFLTILVATENMDAQRRSRTRARAVQQDENMNQWYAISLGTLGFGTGFSISGKFSYALRFQNRISVGAYAKTFYDLINNFNAPDESLFSYGGGAFTRLNITDEIFLQGEYSFTSFELARNQGRDSSLYPSVGGGYRTGQGDWTYGFHINIPLDDGVRDYLNLEYWIDFNYNF